VDRHIPKPLVVRHHQHDVRPVCKRARHQKQPTANHSHGNSHPGTQVQHAAVDYGDRFHSIDRNLFLSGATEEAGFFSGGFETGVSLSSATRSVSDGLQCKLILNGPSLTRRYASIFFLGNELLEIV
jgi:hypothetical protein